jgi:hypothetical protein
LASSAACNAAASVQCSLAGRGQAARNAAALSAALPSDLAHDLLVCFDLLGGFLFALPFSHPPLFTNAAPD